MTNDILSPNFKFLTPNGELNFNGAVVEFFDDICKKHKVNDETRKSYISDYNNTICPFVEASLPIESYDEQCIKELFERVKRNNSIQDTTFNSRHRHLICDPVKWYFMSDGKRNDWGAFYKFEYDEELGIETALQRVRRSFSDEEAKIIARELLSSPEKIKGEYMGILLCEYLGARLNEAAGVSFGDVSEMVDYPGEYKIRLGVRTTKVHSNELKLGGKTWNAPRVLPLMDVVARALFTRRKYIMEHVSFPTENKKGEVFSSIDDLPIACHGDDFLCRCGTDDISKCTRELFITKLHFDENRMAGISELMFRDSEIYAGDRSPTCYTCRRDMATELSIAFKESPNAASYQQYFMGHKIEDRRFKRNDFTDEFYLHDMKKLLEKSHRVNIVMGVSCSQSEL